MPSMPFSVLASVGFGRISLMRSTHSCVMVLPMASAAAVKIALPTPKSV